MISIDFTTVRWVWLDLDDTVWDFCNNSLKSLAEIYELHSLGRFFATVDDWRACYMRHNHALWELYSAGKVTREFLMHERFTRPLLEAGCDSGTAERMCGPLHVDYLDRLGRYPDLVEGARELLETLRRRGFKTGILSNGFKEVQYRKLASGGIEPLIDCVVLSDEIGVNKPDRRLFDHALQKAGTTAAESVIVGDNLSTDIAGGLGAGWRAVYFNRDGKNDSACGVCDEITRLDELTLAVVNSR